jgi:hypothetical protein
MSTNLYRTCSKVSILIKPSISLAFTLELGLLIATTFFYDCPPITKKLHHPITKKAADFKTSKTALNLY